MTKLARLRPRTPTRRPTWLFLQPAGGAKRLRRQWASRCFCRELQRAKILVHLSCRRRGHNKASRTRGKRQLVQCQGCTDFGTYTYLFFNPSIRISFILNKGLFGTTDDIRTLQQPNRVVLCGLLVCKDPQRVQPAASRAHAPRGCATNRWLERFLAVAQEASRVSPDVHGGRCYSV